MKKLFTFIFSLVMASSLIAQVPQSFKYQAVVRNSSGTVLTNSAIGLMIEIRQGNINGTAVYSETFTALSNNAGIFSVNIGKGSPVTGSFSAIDWGSDNYFLNVAIDINGGTNYQDMGTTQLLSVPYSLYTGSIYVNYSNDTLYIGDQYVIIEGNGGGGGGGGGNTVTDIDGNEYNTVTIGTQTWMAKDLRVTHYPNGDAIPHITDNTAWVDLTDNNTDDAYCFYNNDNNTDYGALYNYAAAIADDWARDNAEGQGVCPDGWHLPSDAEWTTLKDYLGGNLVAGGKMKETGTTHWNSPNDGATNESGFTALPGGNRLDTDGSFDDLGGHGLWWSSTEKGSTTAYYRILYYNNPNIGRSFPHKSRGFSVRCVKN